MKVINNPNQNPVAPAERDKRVAEPGFGKYYTDNMVIAEWSEATGWADAKLQPYGPITLDPAAMVFHYGQEIFEGMSRCWLGSKESRRVFIYTPIHDCN